MPSDVHDTALLRASYCRPEGLLELTTPQQVSAASGTPRSKILAILAAGQACVSELAGMLAIPRGTVAYHLHVLQEAGLVHVACTRRVRGVSERYYARVARWFLIEQHSDSGAPRSRHASP